MAQSRLLKAKGLVSFPLLLALGLAVACGASATATPAPTATKAPAAAAPTATPVPAAKPQPTPAPAVVAQPKYGGHIPMLVAGAPAQWDPHKSNTLSTSMAHSGPLYNKLVEYDPETPDLRDIKGDLAKTWEVSKDGTSYIFRLHENIRWWDGKPLTAADVVFSLDRIMQPGEPRPWSGQIGPYYKSSRAIDDRTVQVEIPFGTPLFLAYLGVETNKVLPKHLLEAGVDIGKLDKIVGSGPFKVKNYNKDVSVEYIKNPDYFKQGYPRVDGMTFFIIKDHGTVLAAFKTGQILMCAGIVCNLDIDEAQKLIEDMKGKLVMDLGGPFGVRGMIMNTKKAPFDDVRVRHALQLALDRQSANQLLSKGVNRIGGPFAPDTWFSRTQVELAKLPGYRQTSDGQKHLDDLAEARRLLTEAGFPNGFKTTLKTFVVLDYTDAVQLVSEQLRRLLNIDATIKTGEIAAMLEQYAKGDFDLAVLGEGMLILDPSTIFAALYLENGSRNYSRWRNDRIEEIYNLHVKETNEAKRLALVREAEDYFINVDTPWIGIDWPLRPIVREIRIQNYHVSGGAISELKWEHLWCKPECR